MKIAEMSAVVTGGASGLGAATAASLASAGARVAVFDLDRAHGERIARRIDGMFVAVDVTDERSVAAALDSVSAAHGVPRILVNCAGICPAATTVDRDNQPHPIPIFRRAIEVNLIGSFCVTAHVASRLASSDEMDGERGVIINTASVSAFDGQIGQAAYSASKAGLVGMTLPIARDLAIHKIRVMGIAPGVFLTPMVEGLPQRVQDSLGKQVPHPSRLGRPEEFALLVESIVRNPMLNGEVIRLDGAIRLAPK